MTPEDVSHSGLAGLKWLSGTLKTNIISEISYLNHQVRYAQLLKYPKRFSDVLLTLVMPWISNHPYPNGNEISVSSKTSADFEIHSASKVSFRLIPYTSSGAAESHSSLLVAAHNGVFLGNGNCKSRA